MRKRAYRNLLVELVEEALQIMKIVYAMCSPRQLDFYLTDRREAVPPGATVFAICTNDRTIENQDEDLFAAITDEEYFTLRRMVNEAERLEAESRSAPAFSVWQTVRNFFSRLLALLFGAGKPKQARRFPTSSADAVSPVRM
ncbi:MAG: hypothetical protein ICV68_07445 [Pyrinomonadaceae bacterium]|nr:hypothetical protein [Pyrinomonadaceae bacterium]